MAHSNLFIEILRNLWFNLFLFVLGSTATIFCFKRYITKREVAYRCYGVFFTGSTLIIILQFFQRSFSRSSLPGIMISFTIAIILVISVFYFYLGFKTEKKK